MATYPVVNQKTGEQKEIMMSVHDWDQWCTDNPDWSRDYSDPTSMPLMGVELGEWRDKVVNKNPGWGDILKSDEKSGGISGRLAITKNIGTTESEAMSD